ncbi:Hypothetical predicted protein [Paramuricea clavata]|uniref:Uncharacterized protein n=1 Tax=Paramuricea clavata TaxID=317549 RepID=A0A7D9KYG2_PARCT|nr:Hypothetical predicted protein [Paramuricea clavata]
MRAVNKAIQRERHITPAIDDVIADLNDAKVFSKLDLNQGYQQLELSEESRYVTTFSTHGGLRRYKRLNFGVTSAAEIFQNTIRETLEGLNGCINISDDILVYGSNQKEHDNNLKSVLERLQSRNLTLHKLKCEFNKTSVEYFGYVFSSQSISPDTRKVEAIRNSQPPSNPNEVRSFLGMVNFCARFIPNLATLAKPLRDLTKQHVKWKWTSTEQHAMDSIKSVLTGETTMAYYNPSHKIEVLVDASPVGLGAILGITVLRHPLERLFNDPPSKPPARIERWLLKVQPYRFNVQYQPGSDNPADFMSRHPLPSSPTSHEERCAEEYVNFVSMHAVPKALTLEEIKEATKADTTLQAVIQAVQTKQWHNAKLQPRVDRKSVECFFHIQNELSVNSDQSLRLRGTRIVIPSKLQNHVIDLAHESHQGISRTKQLLREKVWFPTIDKQVEGKVSCCLVCQVTTNTSNIEPLHMPEASKNP